MSSREPFIGVVISVVIAVSLSACSTPVGGDGAPSLPAGAACISKTHPNSDGPLTTPAHGSAFSPALVPMTAYMRTGGDTVTGQQAILDFPVASTVASADQAVVLSSFTVDTTDPGGWQLSRSLMVVAFRTQDGTRYSEPGCALQTPEVQAAMRAAGRQPLPERIEPGHSATGWVAFAVPRAATDVTLWMRHLDADGGYAGSATPLLHVGSPTTDN